eukprot:COSAG02_NODE_56757_length_284_cov_0.481081_1_plen_69_part_10
MALGTFSQADHCVQQAECLLRFTLLSLTDQRNLYFIVPKQQPPRSSEVCSMHLDLWRRRLRMDRLLDQS